jgi:hypothetical protein
LIGFVQSKPILTSWAHTAWRKGKETEKQRREGTEMKNGETLIKVGSHCVEEGERNGKTKKGRNGNKEWRDSDKGRLTLRGGRGQKRKNKEVKERK